MVYTMNNSPDFNPFGRNDRDRMMGDAARDHIMRGTLGTYGEITLFHIPQMTEFEVGIVCHKDHESMIQYYREVTMKNQRYSTRGYALGFSFSLRGFRSMEPILLKVPR